ncbi:hypothetical protein QBC45DRAFT_443810 [Copromyces sp. CBS 386.78]|nr:hypothetical protein QBC45DRAFT_443810 [Copromyces sp. CBS 386.78]
MYAIEWDYPGGRPDKGTSVKHGPSLTKYWFELGPVSCVHFSECASARRALLLLGAKWFDSDARRAFVFGLMDDDDRDLTAARTGQQPPPTAMERRWVAVAYPDGRGPEGGGGLWVAEFDTVMYGFQEKENLAPGNVAQVQLARNMGEKVEILKRMRGKFYASLEEYGHGDGKACINSWATKTTGEFGPLVKTDG